MSFEYQIDRRDQLEIMQVYQDVSLTIQETLELDPMDRLILMELIAAILRNEEVGATVASLSRATGRSYTTIHSRVSRLAKAGHVKLDEDGGIQLADPDLLGVYEEFVAMFLKRMAPILARIVNKSGGTVTIPSTGTYTQSIPL